MVTVAVVFAIALFGLVLLHRARVRRAERGPWRYSVHPGEARKMSPEYPTVWRRGGDQQGEQRSMQTD